MSEQDLELNETLELQAFIDGVAHYFNHITGHEAVVGTPFLRTDENPALDYTGMIGVSGARKGFVYFSSSREMLENILDAMGETDFCNEHIIDITGEIANTISGNVRSRYGQNFMISVPAVLSGGPHKVNYPGNTATYIIPISWKQYEPRLMISLE